jgi:hypothetical protein
MPSAGFEYVIQCTRAQGPRLRPHGHRLGETQLSPLQGTKNAFPLPSHRQSTVRSASLTLPVARYTRHRICVRTPRFVKALSNNTEWQFGVQHSQAHSEPFLTPAAAHHFRYSLGPLTTHA